MSKKFLRIFLPILFFLLIASPLFIMPFVAEKLGRGWQRELSVALGFVGLTLAGWQLAPVSRFTPAQKLFNMDRLYTLHHILSVMSALFVLVHYLLLLMNFEAGVGINNWALNLLNIFSAETPLRAKMGVLSLLAYLLITVTSIFRQKLKVDYDVWRAMHDVFTLLLVGGGITHVLLVGRYSAAPAMNTLLWVLTALWILAALYIRVFKPLYQLRHPYQITAIHPETEGVYSLNLTPQGFDLPTFHPGQVAWLTVRRSPFRCAAIHSRWLPVYITEITLPLPSKNWVISPVRSKTSRLVKPCMSMVRSVITTSPNRRMKALSLSPVGLALHLP